MCLTTKSKTPPEKTGYFYKYVCLSASGAVRAGYRKTNLKTGQWITAGKKKIYMRSRFNRKTGEWMHEYYPAGFHGYKTLAGARKAEGYYSTVIKVRYSGAHTQGKQNDTGVVVARKIYIPLRPKNLNA